MDVQLLATIYDRKQRSLKEQSNHYATFGMFRAYEGVPPTGTTYVTIGVKQGDKVATIDVRLSELEKIVRMIEEAS